MNKLSRRNYTKLIVAAGALGALSEVFFDRSVGTLLESRAETQNVVLGEDWIPTTCWIGKQDCGMLARRINGRVVKFEGHPDHPRNRGTLCPKGVAQISALYDPYRVKAPLKRVNEKGKPGDWVEISWDEALTLVGEKIKEVKARDPKLFIWQKGRSKAKNLYDTAFGKATGATTIGHGAYCSDAAYRAAEYNIGFHGGVHPDFRHCKYLLNWGWGITEAGGNKLCWLTWNRQLVEARGRGLKVITIDPRRQGAGQHTDDWLPIKPGTDLAFFLSLANVLVENGYIDKDYLKNHTNAPFLVKEDGYFLKVDEKEQVWDNWTESAKTFDTPIGDPALEGDYVVNGEKVKTVFQVFKEHLSDYTPEFAADICDLPSETIKRIAMELGENAMIGSTIVIDGVELPHRPVAMMGYHVSQQELGFQAFRAGVTVFMLLGAIESVGGLRVDFSRGVYKNFKALDEIEIKDPPYNIYLKDSKFYPINSKMPGIAMQAMLNPEKYGVDYTPEVMVIHHANPVLSFLQQDIFFEAYMKFKFIAVIDPWMSETADYFADIVLPAATIEKYEGPLNVTDQYNDATSMRIPPIQPLFQSRGEIDIYMGLCEKVGVLYGEDGYIDQVNKALKLKDEHKLDLNAKPDVRDIFDRWAKTKGYEEGIQYFEEKGVKVKPIPVEKLYAPAWDPPYGGIRHRIYGESLKRYQDVMKDKGADEIYWRDYTPLPIWRNPTMNQSPSDYDLYLISHKKIVYKQSRTTFIPLLNELEPEQRLEINPETAKAKGIEDGDEVWIESHNALTDETRKIKVKTKYLEGIRPDTVALPHHYGFWVHPRVKEGGPTPNAIFPTGEGYVTNTADQSFHVKVRVYKG